MSELSPIARQIWDMKYRLKKPDGEPVDLTHADTWRRVAGAVAAAEADPAAWARRFYAILEDFAFLPAGRILAGAGTGRSVTLFNCFVMGTIPDSMAGIFEGLKEAALTMQQGGGIGYDFSSLRPRGAPVHGVGADASGPLSFMDVWDAMCRTIMSAGARRGAMMATMRCDHPDIESFIDAKRQAGRLAMFNLSVLATDAFMRAVKDDAGWDLVFGGRVFATVGARALWDRIMRATYETAEPGVIFIDRVNELNNLSYAEKIDATNPCIVAESWVQTAEGPRQARELVGTPFTACVNGRLYQTDHRGFFSTGRRPVLRLATREGHRLRLTADHPVARASVLTRFRREVEWAQAGSLKPGDLVVLSDHRARRQWPGPLTEHEGYLVGLLVGDGTLKADKAVLSAWPERVAANDARAGDGVRGMMAAALEAARRLPHRADFRGWMEVPGRGEARLATGALRDLALSLGMRLGAKDLGAAVERTSSAFHAGFLRGLFDTDGTVGGTQAKGISVRLAQSDMERLRVAQRMLQRLGIVSTIFVDRRIAGTRMLPDGRGGSREYDCLAQHELVIARDNLTLFLEAVGFADTAKRARLTALLGAYRRAFNRERFVAEVASIEPDGEEEVFDVVVPGANAFCANGLLVHNCGEQPLPPYGACLLGSVNLARLVEAPFTPEARLDEDRLRAIVPDAVRLMDDVIDLSNFPLPAQAAEARAKRRIGLGITGLADALIMCGVRYGSDRAVELTGDWLGILRRQAYLASAGIAAEKGPFPLFDAARYLDRPMVRSLDPDVQGAIARHGIRNALLTSIAPTGTISLFADNVSSGIEPVFAYRYTRNILLPDGTRRAEEVTDYAWRLFRRLHGEEAPLPAAFVDAQSLAPMEHLRMQAAAQAHIDSSISKTINCPPDLGFEAFKDVYAEAFRLGCKGCTTFRPNPVTGAVLEVARPAEPQEAAPPRPAADGEGPAEVVYMTEPLDRPEALPGRTYKLRWPDSDHAIYVTVNDILQDGRRRPFEVFINSKNMEHYAWTVALTRMISAVFRRGGDVAFVVEELKAVFDPRGGHWMGGRYVPSLLAAIGEVIERHMIDIGFLPQREPPELAARAVAIGGGAVPGRQCPKCGRPALIQQEGCDVCLECGFSRCS